MVQQLHDVGFACSLVGKRRCSLVEARPRGVMSFKGDLDNDLFLFRVDVAVTDLCLQEFDQLSKDLVVVLLELVNVIGPETVVDMWWRPEQQLRVQFGDVFIEGGQFLVHSFSRISLGLLMS
ncbi:BEM_collapsed_G0058240.mRNA.1.CDS.1 [Saccharomyces cerevisiae]|nr:BEM_collapsed_G0058240.mRNA.1.CDS.1 [Saccharomyces cerevisiae]